MIPNCWTRHLKPLTLPCPIFHVSLLFSFHCCVFLCDSSSTRPPLPLYIAVLFFLFWVCGKVNWCHARLSPSPGRQGRGWSSCRKPEMAQRRRGRTGGERHVSWGMGSEKKIVQEEKQQGEVANSCTALPHLPLTASWTSLESLPSSSTVTVWYEKHANTLSQT